MLRKILTYLAKLSCGHIRSSDQPMVVGELEWCNVCGDFRTVKES